jgi:hypothetical protein
MIGQCCLQGAALMVVIAVGTVIAETVKYRRLWGHKQATTSAGGGRQTEKA